MNRRFVRDALGLGCLLVAGCSSKSGPRTLVLADVTAPSALPDVAHVVVAVGTLSRTFSTAGNLGPAALRFGVFLPDDVTGIVAVSASASGGTPCVSYAASGNVTIDKTGDEKELPLALVAVGSCSSVDGGVGTGGSAGATDGGTGGIGAAGAGGTGGRAPDGGTTDARPLLDAPVNLDAMPVVPPSLNRCTEYPHDTTPCPSDVQLSTYVWSVAFSPNGNTLATAGDDGHVKLWNVNSDGTLTPNGLVFSTNGESHIAFSNDGQFLAAGSQQGVLDVWSLPSGAKFASLQGHTDDIYAVAFSPDSQSLISISADLTLKKWSLAAKTATSVTLTGVPWALSVSPVSSMSSLWVAVAVSLNSGDAGEVDFLDLSAGTPAVVGRIPKSTGYFGALTFSPDGNALVTGGEDDGSISLWNVSNRAQPTATPATPIVPADPNSFAIVWDLHYFNGGEYLLVGYDGEIREFAASSKQDVGNHRPTWGVLSTATTPDGKIVAGGERGCGLIVVCHD